MTVTVQSAIDEKNPPAGARLQALATAAAYGVTLREMAEHAGVPRQTLFRALSENQWPVRAGADSAAMKRAITELLEARGVEPELLASLFHAHVSNKPPLAAPQASSPSTAMAVPWTNTASGSPQQTRRPMCSLPKQTLSPEARKAFQLFQNPFDGEVMTEEQMFCTGEIAYVREACLQVAVGGRFVALISESGGGKTTILGDLEARIQRDRRPVIVIKPWVLGMEDNDTKGKTLKAADILASIITHAGPAGGGAADAAGAQQPSARAAGQELRGGLHAHAGDRGGTQPARPDAEASEAPARDAPWAPPAPGHPAVGADRASPKAGPEARQPARGDASAARSCSCCRSTTTCRRTSSTARSRRAGRCRPSSTRAASRRSAGG